MEHESGRINYLSGPPHTISDMDRQITFIFDMCIGDIHAYVHIKYQHHLTLISRDDVVVVFGPPASTKCESMDVVGTNMIVASRRVE